MVRQGNLWVDFDSFEVNHCIFRRIRYRARRGQATCPQDKPMDSRCAVRDLPTAPRLGAFGLTRWRLPTAVELEITLNSQYTDTSPMVVAYI